MVQGRSIVVNPFVRISGRSSCKSSRSWCDWSEAASTAAAVTRHIKMVTQASLSITIVEHCKIGQLVSQDTHHSGAMGNYVKLYIRRLRDAAPHVGGYCNYKESLK